MKFEISRASDMSDNPGKPWEGAEYNAKEDSWEIEVRTLEELMALRASIGCDLILGSAVDLPDIVIYDYYIE